MVEHLRSMVQTDEHFFIQGRVLLVGIVSFGFRGGLIRPERATEMALEVLS